MATMGLEITKDLVHIDVEVSSKAELFKLLVDSLAAKGQISDAKAVAKAVLERETIKGTGLARGVACPHAKCPGVLSPCMAVARLKTPLDFNAQDGEPSRHVFLILSPKTADGNPHIAMLASVVSCYRHPGLIKLLDEAQTTVAYADLLTGCYDDES